MSNPAENRRRAVLLPLGLLMLSMAVFGWGLQYKLSLYQSKHSIAHCAPEAKLLSQKERPATVQPPDPLTRLPLLPLVFLAALGLTLYASTNCFAGTWGADDRPPLRPAFYRFALVRPPPGAFFPL